MSFRTAKSRPRIDKVGGLGRPMGAIPVIWGRVGGTRRCQQRLLESDRNWQESAESVPNALLPARGAADLKAKASCRRPPKYKKCKTCQNEHLQKLIILEGFSQNGHHHLFQRICLRIITLVNIYFRKKENQTFLLTSVILCKKTR